MCFHAPKSLNYWFPRRTRAIFWAVTPHDLVDVYSRCWGNSVSACWLFALAYFSTVKMDAKYSSETLIGFYGTTSQKMQSLLWEYQTQHSVSRDLMPCSLMFTDVSDKCAVFLKMEIDRSFETSVNISHTIWRLSRYHLLFKLFDSVKK